MSTYTNPYHFQPSLGTVAGTEFGMNARVNVEVFEGRLRLRWRYAGKRYCLALGLSDRPINRIVGEQKARGIEADIATGNFDASLKKYRPESHIDMGISIWDLFNKYQLFKQHSGISRSTVSKYRALLPKLKEFFGTKKATSLTREEAEGYREWLLEKLAPVTAKLRIEQLRAAYDWGIKQGLVKTNPFTDVRVKVPALPPPSVFSEVEREQIIEAFRTHPTYHYFVDYVIFAMISGCRPGELIGLRWQSVSDDCSTISIWESLSRGQRKETKTNNSRVIALNSRLQKILEVRRGEKPDPDELVFPSVKGGAIDDHNFRNRAWKPIIDGLGLDYRKPYTTRHTAHSHLLDQGWSPAEVAETMGNSVRVVYSRYAANVRGRRKLPD